MKLDHSGPSEVEVFFPRLSVCPTSCHLLFVAYVASLVLFHKQCLVCIVCWCSLTCEVPSFSGEDRNPKTRSERFRIYLKRSGRRFKLFPNQAKLYLSTGRTTVVWSTDEHVVQDLKH